MAKIPRAGAFGLALSAYDLWKRLPPKQRRALLKQVGKHGPTVAKHAALTAREVAKRAREKRR